MRRARSTPLVKHLEKYPWSSFSAYINKRNVPDWLNRDSVYAELGKRAKYSAYRHYVELGTDDDTARFYQLKQSPAILGDTSFKDAACRKSKSFGIEVDKTGLRQPVELMTIVEAVARHYNLSKQAICKTKRGGGVKNVPRWIAMKLCQQVGGATLTEIARTFTVGHYSTVSQTIGRLNKLMEEDNRTAREFNVLSQDLTT